MILRIRGVAAVAKREPFLLDGNPEHRDDRHLRAENFLCVVRTETPATRAPVLFSLQRLGQIDEVLAGKAALLLTGSESIFLFDPKNHDGRCHICASTLGSASIYEDGELAMVLGDFSTTWSGTPQMRDVDGNYRMAELETENTRLQRLIAELLIRNHELREMLDRAGVCAD
jgi:hypothetical protein